MISLSRCRGAIQYGDGIEYELTPACTGGKRPMLSIRMATVCRACYIDDMLDQARAELDAAVQKDNRYSTPNSREALAEAADKLEHAAVRLKVAGLPTGLVSEISKRRCRSPIAGERIVGESLLQNELIVDGAYELHYR